MAAFSRRTLALIQFDVRVQLESFGLFKFSILCTIGLVVRWLVKF
jgi:hypothetical protein